MFPHYFINTNLSVLGMEHEYEEYVFIFEYISISVKIADFFFQLVAYILQKISKLKIIKSYNV